MPFTLLESALKKCQVRSNQYPRIPTVEGVEAQVRPHVWREVHRVLATECGPGFLDCGTSRINGEEIKRGLGDKVAAVCAYRDHRVKIWCFGWVLDLRTIQLSVTIPSISCFPTENGGCSMVSFDFQRLPSMASPSSHHRNTPRTCVGDSCPRRLAAGIHWGISRIQQALHVKRAFHASF